MDKYNQKILNKLVISKLIADLVMWKVKVLIDCPDDGGSKDL
jgi:hypothetical protein